MSGTSGALLTLVSTCVLLITSANVSAAEDSVNVCGTLTSLTQPTTANNVGSATVGDKTYYLSGTPGPNVSSPQVTVGMNVCLTGQIATTQTGPTPMLIRWSITPAPASTARATAPSSTLPSTNTSRDEGSTSSLVLIALLGLATVTILAVLSLRARSA